MSAAEGSNELPPGDDDPVRLPVAVRPSPPLPPPPPPSSSARSDGVAAGPPLTPPVAPGAPASYDRPVAPHPDGHPVNEASATLRAGAAPPGPVAGASLEGPPGHPAPPPQPGGGQQIEARRQRVRLWAVGLVAALVGAVVAAAVSAVALWPDREVTPVVARPPVTTPDGAMDVRSILDQVQPSVVTIETSVTARGGVFEGAGSGVVLSADGLVMTNAHVISQSEDITVRTFDGATRTATLVGSEPANDLAVIRLEGADDLVPAELGSSSTLQVGEPVIAIGNALNLGGQPSVTTGIVSAVNRTIESQGGEPPLADLIQTDAAINPGNSGGPLVDSSGAVVGMNTAIIQDSQNIGFAISIDSAKPIIDELQQGNGEITPDTPRLGVTTLPLDDVPDAVREQFQIEADQGAFVDDVMAGSGAEAAGVRPGDVIVAIDGEEITSNDQLGEIVREHEPGDSIELTIERTGEQQTLTAVIGRLGD
ncbi:MAG TPA: trypsin-like peptidase domain-containing protein [Acidimicrobiales bacterium]|nr:trypsin-like peptidase domain-containing protein [Acidimicrobiales bacterium]